MVREKISLGQFVDRVQYGVELSAGKSVLHIGCTGGNQYQDPEDSVHAKLHKAARECAGIDIQADQVARFKSHGYDVQVGDAEDFSLPKKDFDLIYAGEVIEHLSNPGRFLMCANGHLALRGKLVLTTPQPFTVWRLLLALVAGRYARSHQGHVCWYDPFLLTQLLERYEFQVEEYHPSGLRECGPMEQILVRARRNLAPEFVVVASKKSESSLDRVRMMTTRSQVTE